MVVIGAAALAAAGLLAALSVGAYRVRRSKRSSAD